MELKGSKLHTKNMRDQAQQGLHACLDNLLTEFPGLDWDYMMNREKGELYCDIGLSYYPESSQPLTGLWRLDALEASFGAAGLTRGTIHHLNTLNLYGGLQSEMSNLRCQRTHVVFRSTYNTAYDVTRQLDNGRDLFKEQDVYNQERQFHSDVEKVISIYEDDACRKSHGLRDEFRIGGQALKNLLNRGPDGLDTIVSLLYVAMHDC